jgi:hypothetical protein
LDDGADHESPTVVSPAVAASCRGCEANVYGVSVAVELDEPVPARFLALTRNVYSVALARPVTE